MQYLAVFDQKYVYKYTTLVYTDSGIFVGNFEGYYSNTNYYPLEQIKNFLSPIILDSFKAKFPHHMNTNLQLKNTTLQRVTNVDSERALAIATNELNTIYG